MSVFSINYWTKKGLSEEEANYQIAIRRPNNILYYINKGFSESEALQEVRKRQSLGGTKRKSLSEQEKKSLSPRCIEFWLAKGLSKEDSLVALAEHQKKFSKDICIKKHGLEKGLKIWLERQERWLETLSKKSKEEKNDINKRKNRWKNLSITESDALKNQIRESLKNTLSTRTKEESIIIGQRIREGQVKNGRATPIELMDQFLLYKSQVWAETRRNDLSLLENFSQRGRNTYHLDHKYSIWQGFLDGADPCIVGHIKNLEMIPYQKNLSKHNKCSHSLSDLIQLIRNTNVQNQNS